MKTPLLSVLACTQFLAAEPREYGFAHHDVISFGENGQLEMLYDRRQAVSYQLPPETLEVPSPKPQPLRTGKKQFPIS